MPWTSKDAHKFSHTADPKKWAAIANAVLRRTGGEESLAIRIANSKAKK